MPAPSRRASQGRKVYVIPDSTDDEDEAPVVITTTKKRKTAQTDLRTFFGKRDTAQVVKGAVDDDHDNDSDDGGSSSKKPRFWIEMPPARRHIPNLSRTQSSIAASSITRSPPQKLSLSTTLTKRVPKKKRFKDSDSDSDFRIDEEEEAAMVAAADELEGLSDAVDEVSEDVESVKPDEDDEEDILMLEEEDKEKPKKKWTTQKKSTSKVGELIQTRDLHFGTKAIIQLVVFLPLHGRRTSPPPPTLAISHQ